ncbi:uncharacterized protein THITE_115269 [Thermothielavioides terrestris NRRL 8126]|uniref:Uncharacterized protein n=1 Tax=Thermothielavioides terrestris (strain ATCC 38088 / NRRL 8126) TaxID=578455 RepID=G2RDQ8_THETT|nr:uncharacterized protein THITE_115269 [Thermothielavioides terrestris NRRL 8126]AEO69989.1 hypothetical protein THITE_115269 [Thermothielavioides terrestris NRRL 8126]
MPPMSARCCRRRVSLGALLAYFRTYLLDYVDSVTWPHTSCTKVCWWNDRLGAGSGPDEFWVPRQLSRAGPGLNGREGNYTEGPEYMAEQASVWCYHAAAHSSLICGRLRFLVTGLFRLFFEPFRQHRITPLLIPYSVFPTVAVAAVGTPSWESGLSQFCGFLRFPLPASPRKMRKWHACSLVITPLPDLDSNAKEVELSGAKPRPLRIKRSGRQYRTGRLCLVLEDRYYSPESFGIHVWTECASLTNASDTRA